jgi:uncharacterized protein
MWQQIANLILRNRFFILGIITLMTVFFGYYAITGLKLDNKYGNMLPKQSATQTKYLKFKELFGEDGGSLVLAIENDSLYTERNFLKWKELGDSILQYNGVQSIISEATLFTINNNTEQNKFEAKRIFSDITYGEKSIKEIEREIKNNPVYRNLLYNDTAKVSIMMISIDEKYLSDTKRANVVLDIEKVAQSYETYFGHIRYAGLPHLRVIIGKKVINEMYIFIGLSIFITSLLLWLFFKSLRVVLICNIVVFVAVIWSMGSIGLLGFNISILMALIPPLMIVIGIPNCIFLMTKYHQEFRAHGNKVKAISRVIKKIGTATFLTNLTTAFGFSTFIFTNSEKLTEFGVVASINILVVFLLSITILPIVLSFSQEPKKRHLKHLDRKFAVGFINRIIHITQFKRKTIYITTSVVVILSVIGLFKITATGNITSDLPQGNQILEDVHFMQNKFGGSIPFEIMIDYKKNGRLFSNETLSKVEEVQYKYSNDSLFSKTISIVDFIKVINMAYHGNDPKQYKLISSRDKLRLKKYLDNFNMTNANGGGFTIKELVDTNETMLRIRTQMMDLGSYEVAQKVDTMRLRIDEIFNPDRKEIERLYKLAEKKKGDYYDSLVYEFPSVYNNLTAILANGDSQKQYEFDLDPDKIKAFYKTAGFNNHLREAIDQEYYDIVLTGTAVVASEGTQYLVINLFTSLLFAIIGIAILMAILFRSWRMVLVSLLPNLIPLVFTGGIMGWFGIPLKPSTLLVFSIAFGISVDDTIHFLAKYRQELKANPYDLKACVLRAIHEAGLGMFYTSIVLFCGFSVFTLSEFGGTQALGLLISLTLLVAMITNLVVLPALLLSLERRLTTKSFVEPYFDAYAEETDMDFDDLQVETKKPLNE